MLCVCLLVGQMLQVFLDLIEEIDCIIDKQVNSFGFVCVGWCMWCVTIGCVGCCCDVWNSREGKINSALTTCTWPSMSTACAQTHKHAHAYTHICSPTHSICSWQLNNIHVNFRLSVILGSVECQVKIVCNTFWWPFIMLQTWPCHLWTQDC